MRKNMSGVKGNFSGALCGKNFSHLGKRSALGARFFPHLPPAHWPAEIFGILKFFLKSILNKFPHSAPENLRITALALARRDFLGKKSCA